MLGPPVCPICMVVMKCHVMYDTEEQKWYSEGPGWTCPQCNKSHLDGGGVKCLFEYHNWREIDPKMAEILDKK